MPGTVNPPGIQGWGADLDPKDRPAYPKERVPARDIGVHWEQPEQQQSDIKVFHSTEREGITPVFGTSAPPSGLSGIMREYGFKFSENDMRHWLVLLAADRVNMVEGIISDLARGHIPNLWKEMGGPAEWKYNKKGLLKKAAVATAVLGAAGTVAYLLWPKQKKKKFLAGATASPVTSRREAAPKSETSPKAKMTAARKTVPAKKKTTKRKSV